MHSGAKEKAAGYLRQGQEIMERLAKLSPQNAQWSQDLAWFGRKLAGVTEDQPPDNKTGQARPPPDAEKTVPARRGMEAIIEPARIPSSRPTITRRRRGQGAAASTGRSTFSSRRSAVGNRRGSGAAPKCRLWSALCTCGASAQKIAAKISLKDP
jgi:hypothetical protein